MTASPGGRGTSPSRTRRFARDNAMGSFVSGGKVKCTLTGTRHNTWVRVSLTANTGQAFALSQRRAIRMDWAW